MTEEEMETENGIETEETSLEGTQKQLEGDLQKYKDLYIRAHADMDNLRKRTAIELEKRTKYAISGFAESLLTVADNLSRALACLSKEETAQASSHVKNMIAGVELTQKELMDVFQKNKITKIESVGKVFSPHQHKVVQEIEDPSVVSGTIVEEYQTGYQIDDRILREAVVIVAKGGPKSLEDLEKMKKSGAKIDTKA